LSGDLLFEHNYESKSTIQAYPVNLINHPYWNLGNHNSGNILDEVVQIFGYKTTLVDDHLILNLLDVMSHLWLSTLPIPDNNGTTRWLEAPRSQSGPTPPSNLLL
ncbi:hypothetical protein Lal_00030197, partial [Lupinus albus]